MHPVFDVLLLQKAVGDYRVEEELPSKLERDFLGQFEPETVLLATRTVNQRTANVIQVMVQWQGKGPEEAT